MMNLHEIKTALRNPSQYSHSEYFITKDGGVLSRQSVRENFKLIAHALAYPEYFDFQWQVIAQGVNYEDLELCCDHTGAKIPAAYAEA